VLADVDRRGADLVYDLGDTLYGPLDPAGTARLLMERDIIGVLGNEDRLLLEPPADAAARPALRHALAALDDVALEWLDSRPPLRREGELLLCHGSPRADTEYLLERVTATGITLRPQDEIASLLGDSTAPVVLCGHSHVPRVVSLDDGRVVVNAGSVGLPAYDDDRPPHAMEAGSPHARYALLERGASGWSVLHVAVPYEWESAAQTAERVGRPDWARWLRTGRAAWPAATRGGEHG
jgi:predicted phosphodiesterase